MPDDALYGKSEYESNDATVFVMNIVSRIAVTSMSRHMTAAVSSPTVKADDDTAAVFIKPGSHPTAARVEPQWREAPVIACSDFTSLRDSSSPC